LESAWLESGGNHTQHSTEKDLENEADASLQKKELP
jgi:hypothetical protein